MRCARERAAGGRRASRARVRTTSAAERQAQDQREHAQRARHRGAAAPDDLAPARSLQARRHVSCPSSRLRHSLHRSASHGTLTRLPPARYTGLTSRLGGVFLRPGPHITTQGLHMARGDVRIAVTLACEECKRRNYQTNKSKRNNPDRITLRKYCRFCRRHTSHRETR